MTQETKEMIIFIVILIVIGVAGYALFHYVDVAGLVKYLWGGVIWMLKTLFYGLILFGILILMGAAKAGAGGGK